MRRDERLFHTYDSTIGVWGTAPTNRFGGLLDEPDPILGADWKSYNAVMRLLRREGFKITQDPGVAKSIRGNYHIGRRGDVLFHSEAFPAGFRCEFYEDVIRDNKYGGRYHFDKMAKAPYLWRLQVRLLHRKIGGLLHALGFNDRTDRVPRDSWEEVSMRRASLEGGHGPGIWAQMRQYYNVNDQDDVEIKDGDTRWFYERNGRLMRGTCFHHINNMWWVIVDRFEVRNIAAFDLFKYDPARHPRKWSPYPIQNLSHAIEKTVKARNYKKAAVMSAALARIADSYDFKVGDHVVVDNTRYHGPGVVDNLNPPFRVGVKLPNGNVWAYEWATVKPAPEAAPCS